MGQTCEQLYYDVLTVNNDANLKYEFLPLKSCLSHKMGPRPKLLVRVDEQQILLYTTNTRISALALAYYLHVHRRRTSTSGLKHHV